jgi:hypothetical protein
MGICEKSEKRGKAGKGKDKIYNKTVAGFCVYLSKADPISPLIFSYRHRDLTAPVFLLKLNQAYKAISYQ